LPAPPRKYDAGDRAAKKEEVKRLAELKRAREAAAADPRPRARPGAGEPPARPKDPTTEGRGAKAAEERALAARRKDELLFGVRMRVAEQSRWKQQAEAQEQTLSSRLRDLFGDAKSGKGTKDAKGRRRK